MKHPIEELEPSTSRKWVHSLYALGYFIVAASALYSANLSNKAAWLAFLLPLSLGVFHLRTANFWRRSEIAFVVAREEETPSEFEARIKLEKFGIKAGRMGIVETISPGFTRFPLELYSAICAPHVIAAYLLWIAAESAILYRAWLFAVRGAEPWHVLFLLSFLNSLFYMLVNYLQVRAAMMMRLRAAPLTHKS